MPATSKIKPTRAEVLAVVTANGSRTRTTLNEVGFAILENTQHGKRLTGLAAEMAELVSMSAIKRHLADLTANGDIVQTTTVRRGRKVIAWETTDSARIREESNQAARERSHLTELRRRAEKWAATELRRLHEDEFENLVHAFIANPANQEN